MIAVSIIILALYLAFYALCFSRILRGEMEFFIYYVIIFFPVYTVFLALVYNGFESANLISFLQYSKEALVFLTGLMVVFGRKDGALRAWSLSLLDKLFLTFLSLSLSYVILGIGEASFLSQAVYFKNILLIGIFYFLGRQIQTDFSKVKTIFKVVMGMTALAFILGSAEQFFGIHFHSLIGYVKYNQGIKDIDPAGIFGLLYTFEAQGGIPRYGSFFANPLEFAASMLIPVAFGVIMMLSVKHRPNKLSYILLLGISFICVLFTYSRATFVAFFLMLLFMAFLLKYYKLLTGLFVLLLISVFYIFLFASEDAKYFVIDTLTFQNSSSITHIIEWLQGVESMINNPFGIGLATSGNAGGVERDLQVGGENQYLIYGVQLGFTGLILYVSMLMIGIRNSWRAYRRVELKEDAVIPFMACTVKFGLLLPLFTANAEAYIYIALFSWWLIGNAETKYQSVISGKRRKPSFKKSLSLS